MGTRSFVRALAAASMIIALTGCSGGGTATTAPTPAPTVGSAPTAASTPTATPTAVLSASPSSAPSQAALDGTMTASGLPETWTGCGGWRGSVQVADLRVAGEYHSVVCTQDRADGSTDFWGVWVLWNDGGTWDGRFVGKIETSGDHKMDLVSTGSGSYASLRLATRASAGPDDSVWAVSSTIEPAPNPTLVPTTPAGPGRTEVTGTRSCGKVVAKPSDTPVGDVTRRRGEVDLCTWTVSDSRLSGQDLTLVSADLLADGSGKGWGSLALRAGDGLWVGSWSIDLEPDGRSTVTTSLAGLLALEGLVYQDVQVGKGDTWTVTGWVSPAE